MKNRDSLDLLYFYPEIQLLNERLNFIYNSQDYNELKPFMSFGEPINSVRASMEIGMSRSTIFRKKRQINIKCAQIIDCFDEIIANFR